MKAYADSTKETINFRQYVVESMLNEEELNTFRSYTVPYIAYSVLELSKRSKLATIK